MMAAISANQWMVNGDAETAASLYPHGGLFMVLQKPGL
jgi:hypothetical protein